MNPVSIPAVPQGPQAPMHPAKPAAGRGVASREEQAAFSPALMLLLAAGIVQPAVTVPVGTAPTPKLVPGGDAEPGHPETAAEALSRLTAVNAATPATPATPTRVAGPQVTAAPRTPAALSIEAPAPATVDLPDAAAIGALAHQDFAALAAERTVTPAPRGPLPVAVPQVHASELTLRATAAPAAPAPVAAQPTAAAPPSLTAPQAPDGLAAMTPAAGIAPAITVAAMKLQPAATEPAEPADRSTTGTVVTSAVAIDLARRAAAVSPGTGGKRQKSGDPGSGDGAPRETAGRGKATPQGRAQGIASAEAAPARSAPERTTPTPVPASNANDASPARAEATNGAAPMGAPADPRLDAADPARANPARADQITLRVQDDQGVEARLRVAVRGRDVRATIVSDDPVMARRLEDGLGHLRQALGDRGFERTQVAVQSAGTFRGDAGKDAQRDAGTKQRQPDAENKPSNERRSDGSDPRSRRRPGREREER